MQAGHQKTWMYAPHCSSTTSFTIFLSSSAGMASSKSGNTGGPEGGCSIVLVFLQFGGWLSSTHSDFSHRNNINRNVHGIVLVYLTQLSTTPSQDASILNRALPSVAEETLQNHLSQYSGIMLSLGENTFQAEYFHAHHDIQRTGSDWHC